MDENMLLLDAEDETDNVNEMAEKIKRTLLSTKRRNMKTLISKMENGGFFTAPCSGGHHLCREGGLAQHSWNVYECITRMATSLLGEDEVEKIKKSLIIVSLLHDLGKIGDFDEPLYKPNILKSGKQSAAKPFSRNKNLLPVEHAETSVCLIREAGVPISMQECFAIRYHDGLYVPANALFKGNETPLSLLLHWADMWSSRVIEVVEKEEEENDDE